MTFYSKNKTEQDSSTMVLNKIIPMVIQKENGIQMIIRKLNKKENHALKVELLLKEVSSAKMELEEMQKENFKLVQERFEHKNTISNLEGANTQLMVQLQMFQRQFQQIQMQQHQQVQQHQQKQMQLMMPMPIAPQVLVANRSPQMMTQNYYMPQHAVNIPQNPQQFQQHGGQFSKYNNSHEQNHQKNNIGERQNNYSQKNHKSNQGRKYENRKRHNKRDNNRDNNRDNHRDNHRDNKRDNKRDNRRHRADSQKQIYQKDALLNPNSPPIPVSADHEHIVHPPTHHKKSKMMSPSSIPTIEKEKIINSPDKKSKMMSPPSIPTIEKEKVIKFTDENAKIVAPPSIHVDENNEEHTLESPIPFVSNTISNNDVADSFTAPSAAVSRSVLFETQPIISISNIENRVEESFTTSTTVLPRLETQPIISNIEDRAEESFTTSTRVLPRLLKANSSSGKGDGFFSSESWKTLATSEQESNIIEQSNNDNTEELKPTAVDCNAETPYELSLD